MTMSRDIEHTKSATLATQHTENINPNENNINMYVQLTAESFRTP